MTKFLSLLVSLTWATLAAADFGGLYGWQHAIPAPLTVYGPFCASDTSNLTTYTYTGITLTGVADTDPVAIWVGIVAEDSAAAFQTTSATIEGASATEVTDEGGSGTVTSSIYRGNNHFVNAASVDVSVTYSEAVTGSAVCVWALKDNVRVTGLGGGVNDDDAASGALVLTISQQFPAYSTLFGVSGSADVDTTTWAVLTEGVDTDNGEFSYSAAHVTVTTTTSTPAITSDYAGAGNATGCSVGTQ